MKFKLDENIPVELKDDLSELGYDSDSVVSEGLKGADDRIVVRAADHAKRILLTLDKGIPRLVQRRKHSGVVVGKRHAS